MERIYESICKKYFSCFELEKVVGSGNKVKHIFYDDFEVIFYDSWQDLFNTVVREKLKQDILHWGIQLLGDCEFSDDEISLIESEVL